MKLGAHYLPEDFSIFMDSLRAAEDAGLDRAYLVDSQMLWEDVWVYMTHALAGTERIQIGVAVANPLTRHYSVAASAAATLARMHPGRVILGLGRGDSAVRTLGLKQVATKKFAEIVPKVRGLMGGEEVDGARIRWTTGERVPILVSATGPRNLRIAGATADIAMLQVGATPAGVKWAIDQVHAGAEEAGRDPAEIEIALFCGLWVSDDRDEINEHTRWAAACGANHLGDVIKRVPDHDMPEELYRVVLARDQAYDYYEGHLDSSAEHTGYLSDELIDDFAISGTAEQCAAKIRELEALGVTEVSGAYFNGQIEQLQRIGRELVPLLARVAA